MSELIDLYRAHRGKVSDRWSAYLTLYEHVFSSWRNRPLRLLEIGVQNGGSLEIWRRYFPNAKLLVGCDVDLRCAELGFVDPQIRVVVGDACTDETERRLAACSPEWDIIIDDGSHQSRHIINAFSRYFPRLSLGGIYVAEDLHCSYWQEFQGGIADPLSSMSFFKRLADLVNYEHWGADFTRSEYLSLFSAHYDCSFDERALAHVHALQFYNSQCVVYKAGGSDNTLGPRVVSGEIELVARGVKEYDGTLSPVRDETGNPWSSENVVNVPEIDRFLGRYLALESKLLAIHAEARRQRDQLYSLELEVSKLTAELAGREASLQRLAEDKVVEALELARKESQHRAELADAVSSVKARDQQIEELLTAQASPAAQAASLIVHVARKAFPPRSRRGRLLGHTLAFAQSVYRIGLLRTLRIRKVFNSNLPVKHGGVATGGVTVPPEFAAWIRNNEPREEDLSRRRLASSPFHGPAPLFSVIVPVYKIASNVLQAMVQSVLDQTWRDWEMCIAYADLQNGENWELLKRLAANEPRIKIEQLSENGGISRNSNAALKLARGEFIVLLDHDDELSAWALEEMAVRIRSVPEVDFLYSDKDSINADGTMRQMPLFKPAWSPEMLFSVNYLTHMNVMRRSIVESVGGWNPETDGAQDWDIFFRVAERSRRIERVTGIHYHWRIIEGSTSTGLGAKPYALLGQLRTLEMRVKRLGLPASVVPNAESGYRLVWHIEKTRQVDVVLHGGQGDISEALALLGGQCEELVASVTLVWTGLGPPPTGVGHFWGGVRFAVVHDPNRNKTDLVADAFSLGRAPAVLLIDCSVVGFTRHSLRDLAGWVLRHPEIGFATSVVVLEDDTVVESGWVVGIGGGAQPLFRGTPLRHWGPFGGPLWCRNVSAAGDSAIAFKRDRLKLDMYRGMDWRRALIGLCADSRGNDRRGVVVPYARATVGKMPELVDVWDDSMRDDPYFHPEFQSVVPLLLRSGER